MDTIVVCGGKASRVQSITKNKIPKILIEVNNRPFLEYLIELLYDKGVRVVHLAAGFRSEILEDYLAKRSFLSSVTPYMKIELHKEEEPLDTGGGLFNVLNKIWLRLSDPFLVINGDCLIDIDEESFEEEYYTAYPYGAPDLCMHTCLLKHDGRYGNLVIDIEHKVITGFRNNKPGESWINCGWYIFKKSFFDKYLKAGYNTDVFDVKRISLEKDIFPDYLKESYIGPLPIGSDQFSEIGTPEAIEEASRKLK